MVEVSASDQLDYYLASLNELGEVLIDAEKPESVGKGILRLMLGTVMASKGAIFLYHQKKDVLSILASQGLKKGNHFHRRKNSQTNPKNIAMTTLNWIKCHNGSPVN